MGFNSPFKGLSPFCYDTWSVKNAVDEHVKAVGIN